MNIDESSLRPASAVDAPLMVGVACFAGDIGAPAQLVSALPADSDAAFIFVQSAAAGREGLLFEALANRKVLPVVLATDGLIAQRGHIYVIPPNVRPLMSGSRICMTPAAAKEFDCPADVLFISLAEEFGHNAIGVSLSGGVSDRALGIRTIRQVGGTTFAQYPGSARFPNMPIEAIDTGCVDFVLRPYEIAHELTRISRRKEKGSRGALENCLDRDLDRNAAGSARYRTEGVASTV